MASDQTTQTTSTTEDTRTMNIRISTTRTDRAVIRDAVQLHGCTSPDIVAITHRAGAIMHPDTGRTTITLPQADADALRDTLWSLVSDDAEMYNGKPSVAWITASGLIDQIDGHFA
jgi:hypothetical protein